MRIPKVLLTSGTILVAGILDLAASGAKAGDLVAVRAGLGLANSSAGAAVLPGGQTIAGLAGGAGSRRYFKVHVPANRPRLTIRTSGGMGDCDLYLSRGRLPEPKGYQYASEGRSTNENITISAPAPGTWYVLLYGYRRFDGVRLAFLRDGTGQVPGRGRWIRVLSPTPTTAWRAGGLYWIRWTTSGHTRRVGVMYSFDDGRTWMATSRTGHVPASAGRLLWRMPVVRVGRRPTVVRFRVVDLDNPSIHAVSAPIRLTYEDSDRDRHDWRGRGLDPHEPDNRTSRAGPIGLRTVQLHTIAPEEDEDWLVFVPPAPGLYRLDLTGLTLELKVRIYTAKVGRSREDKIRTCTVRGPTSIDLQAHPQIRYFKIHVEARDDDDTGAYRVAVSQAGGRRGVVLVRK